MDHLKTLNTADLASMSGGDNGNLWTFIGKAIGSTARAWAEGAMFAPAIGPAKEIVDKLNGN